MAEVETVPAMEAEKSVLCRLDASGRVIVPDGYKTCDADGVPMIPMKLTLQGIIDSPPEDLKKLYEMACSNDTVTIDSWFPTWKKHIKENCEKFNVNDCTVMSEFAKEAGRAVIIAGSGPSLKKNFMELKNRHDVKVVSCLHNFGLFEKHGIMTDKDYYINLDAGEITLPEVFEGNGGVENWELTKNRTLVTHIFGNPKLLEKWQGSVKFFYSAVNQPELLADIHRTVDQSKVPVFNVGGNALGACMYMAKAILGAGALIFIGADFCFDYKHSFHAWKSPYDAQFSGVIPYNDIFGNRVFTWRSYYQFAQWFTYMAYGGKGMNPQLFINATEGGILGAYPQGNVRNFLYMSLREAIHVFTMYVAQKDITANAKEKGIGLLF